MNILLFLGFLGIEKISMTAAKMLRSIYLSSFDNDSSITEDKVKHIWNTNFYKLWYTKFTQSWYIQLFQDLVYQDPPTACRTKSPPGWETNQVFAKTWN